MVGSDRSDNIYCELGADRQQVTIDLPPAVSDRSIATRVLLSARLVDGLIRELARLRNMMPDPHPQDVDTSGRLLSVVNPRWRHTPEALMGGSIVSFRHPGLGWLHFCLPKREAAHLGGLLVKNSELPVPADTTPRN